LSAQDFRPAAIRADRRGAAEMARTAAWLLDAGTAVLAEQASQLGYSDADWTAYIEQVERLGESDTSQDGPATGTERRSKTARAAPGREARG
jgi:hypothetical protein